MFRDYGVCPAIVGCYLICFNKKGGGGKKDRQVEQLQRMIVQKGADNNIHDTFDKRITTWLKLFRSE